jgi:hypothetical protein
MIQAVGVGTKTKDGQKVSGRTIVANIPKAAMSGKAGSTKSKKGKSKKGKSSRGKSRKSKSSRGKSRKR